MTREHPCPFPEAVLDIFRINLAGGGNRVLDPFGGIGRIHELRTDERATVSVELEQEWVDKTIAAYSRPGRMFDGIFQGDATSMPYFDDRSFDYVATSPAFGNRMADGYAGERCKTCEGAGSINTDTCDDCAGSGRKLRSRRHTYRLDLGRPLSEGNGAAMQWGDAYRELHERCVVEFMRVLKVGGYVLLDIKNHRRDGEEQRVVEWWTETIHRHGGALQACIPVNTMGLQHSGPDTNDLPEVVLIFLKEY